MRFWSKSPSSSKKLIDNLIFELFTILNNLWLNVFSTGSCRYVYSTKTFLFSLYNINGYAPVKLNIKSSRYSNAIFTCSSFGPSLGYGQYLHINNNAASNRKSFTACNCSFTPPTGYSGSCSYCNYFVGGSSLFTPTDAEVFYETTT